MLTVHLSLAKLQGWLIEMANFVKSIDRNHLLTIGLEGFYGPTTPERLSMNPSEWAGSLGTDFIQNSKIPSLDFASIHIYPDQWWVQLMCPFWFFYLNACRNSGASQVVCDMLLVFVCNSHQVISLFIWVFLHNHVYELFLNVLRDFVPLHPFTLLDLWSMV